MFHIKVSSNTWRVPGPGRHIEYEIYYMWIGLIQWARATSSAVHESKRRRFGGLAHLWPHYLALERHAFHLQQAIWLVWSITVDRMSLGVPSPRGGV